MCDLGHQRDLRALLSLELLQIYRVVLVGGKDTQWSYMALRDEQVFLDYFLPT